MRIDGRLFGLFAFDVGYAIDLDRARDLTQSQGRRGLSRQRATPRSLEYARPPLQVPLGRHAVDLRGEAIETEATATLYDFGVVTVQFEVPLHHELAELPILTAHLTRTATMEARARDLVVELARRIEPAVARPGLSDLVEDYYVVQADRVTAPGKLAEWVERGRAELASTLRCETARLSPAEIDDALRSSLSYYDDDFLVADWNVAVIIDPEYTDALSVLEYLNVQLLELRYHDALLDRHIADAYELTGQGGPRRSLLFAPYRQSVVALADTRVDVGAIYERVHNALKLSGDLYLAKVYGRTAERLGLAAWERSVERKLEVVETIYAAVLQRVSTSRAELLEMTIIVLIVLEIVLFLVGLA